VEYTVTWRIEVDADSPEHAARTALEMQRDPDSLATHFEVVAPDGRVVEVDLLRMDEPERSL